MAQKVVLSSGKVAYITNTLADGTQRDSMEGFVLRENEQTKPIFDVFYSVLRSIQKREAEAARLAETASMNSSGAD